MEDNFKIEIISPEKIIFSDSVKMVKIPSYEGDMSILKNHISIITFLRPGLVKVEKNDNEYDLTELAFNGGSLQGTGAKLPLGKLVRVHIRARDVSLTLEQPKNTSILNIFEGTIIEINNGDHAQVDIKIDVGSPIIARITKKSFDELRLKIGSSVYTMIKAVAIDGRSLV